MAKRNNGSNGSKVSQFTSDEIGFIFTGLSVKDLAEIESVGPLTRKVANRLAGAKAPRATDLLRFATVASFFMDEMDAANLFEVEPGTLFVPVDNPQDLRKVLAKGTVNGKDAALVAVFNRTTQSSFLTVVTADLEIAVLQNTDGFPNPNAPAVEEKVAAPAPETTKKGRRGVVEVVAPKATKKAKKTPKAKKDAGHTRKAADGNVSEVIRDLMAKGKNKGAIIKAIADQFYAGDTNPAGRRVRHLLRKVTAANLEAAATPANKAARKAADKATPAPKKALKAKAKKKAQ